jgi:hypothetical protein
MTSRIASQLFNSPRRVDRNMITGSGRHQDKPVTDHIHAIASGRYRIFARRSRNPDWSIAGASFSIDLSPDETSAQDFAGC